MIITGKPDENGQVELTFALRAEQVPGPTSVVGDFNGWDPFAHPLRPAEDGTWRVTATVPADREVTFRYLADGGVWFDDAEADWYDEHGGHLTVERLNRAAWAAEQDELAACPGALHAMDLGPLGFERPTFGPVPSV
ncbi:MAG: isoamylase early set domain-containing protein [Actinomycetes bacterium]